MKIQHNDLLSEEQLRALENFNGFTNKLGGEYARIAEVEVEISNETPFHSFENEADTSELDEEIERLKGLLRELDKELGDAYRKKDKEEITRLQDELAKNREQLDKKNAELERLKHAKVLTLGEYVRLKPGDTPKIVLYINNITSCGGNTEWLQVQTYAHEMMHAYYDHDISKPHTYTSFVEEPITELGMLDLMKKYDTQVPGIFDDAFNNVKQKQNETGCMHYGFGAYLYEKELPADYWIGIMHDAKYNALDPALLDRYKKPFARGIYPTNEQQHADWLEELLDTQAIFKSINDCDIAINELNGNDPIKVLAINRRRTRCAEKAKRVVSVTVSNKRYSNFPIYNALIDEDVKNGKAFSFSKRKTVDNTVDYLLCTYDQLALLVGYVQCGKTSTYEKIIGKSFDCGRKICVVFTKNSNLLADQTKKRLETDFYQFLNPTTYSTPLIKIEDIRSIGTLDSSYYFSDDQDVHLIIVCMKEATSLEKLRNQLKGSLAKDLPILFIDDEADFGGINYETTDGKDKLKPIADKLNEIRQITQNSSYLQVTATPSSLVLQSDVDQYERDHTTGLPVANADGKYVRISSFRPGSIFEVPTHSKYIGGDHFFGHLHENPNSMYNHIDSHIITDQDLVDLLNNSNKTNYTDSLYNAINQYLIATAIRVIQNDNTIYRSCCAVHIATDKKAQKNFKNFIDNIIKDIQNNIKSSKWSTDSFTVKAYQDFKESNNKGVSQNLISTTIPALKDIEKGVKSIIANGLTITVVNSDTTQDQYIDPATGQLKLKTKANIYIGGYILDRGITIDNLITFIYGRNPNSYNMDTVLQHARMYGARSLEDMAVTRLVTTIDLYNILKKIYELDERLRENLRQGIYGVPVTRTIKPCALSKLIFSDCHGFTSTDFVHPNGMYINSSTVSTNILKIKSTVSRWTVTDTDSDNWEYKEVSYKDAVNILKEVFDTFTAEPLTGKGPFFTNKYKKTSLNECKEMLGLNKQSINGKIQQDKVLVVIGFPKTGTHYQLSRIRKNGKFIDAPMPSGVKSDMVRAMAKKHNKAVLVLLPEAGNVNIDNYGRNVGWQGVPFYWPVIVPPLFDDNGIVFAE